MYKVTKVEPYNSRLKVYLNEDKPFVLYKGEIRKFKIVENGIISDDIYNIIMDTLFKRAKERAIYLIEDSMKTEYQIVDKLKKGMYPDEIIDRTVIFLKDIKLIDDENYAMLYIDYKRKSRSKIRIIQDLTKKGIKRQVIDNAIEDSELSDTQALSYEIEKKKNKYDLSDRNQYNKFIQYLMRKGFKYSDIKSILDVDIYY